MEVRDPTVDEAQHLARLWSDGWHEAHGAILPSVVVRARTPETFLRRMQAAVADVRAIGPIGSPVGFSMTREDELHQLYVTSSARGTGFAAALLSEAEARLRQQGARNAWLACAIGNLRAARFYEKAQWIRVGTVDLTVDLESGPIGLRLWRYEKALGSN